MQVRAKLQIFRIVDEGILGRRIIFVLSFKDDVVVFSVLCQPKCEITKAGCRVLRSGG